MLAKDSEFVEDLVALLIVEFGIKRRVDSRVGMRGWRLEPNAADMEIFLEAIELQKVDNFKAPTLRRLARMSFAVKSDSKAFRNRICI